MKEKLYALIANKLIAIENCRKSGNLEWKDRHAEAIEQLVKQHLPSGSGFDSGTKLDWDKSTPERLVFEAPFHHMDGHGFYSGWSEHEVIVKASLAFGFELRITGRDRNDIKDYMHEVFHAALSEEVEG
jgi:hypothetical protein